MGVLVATVRGACCFRAPVVGAVRVSLERRATDEDEDIFSASSLKDAYRRVQVSEESTTKTRVKRPTTVPSGPVGMRDRRVQEAQEPRNELRELLESESWGLLGLPAILLRLTALFVVTGSIAFFFVDNYDTYNELVSVPLANRLFLAALCGSFASLASALRLQGQWNYVSDRLTDTNLYFEQTGWADGFSLDKPDDTAFRDKILRDQEVKPRLNIVQQAVYANLLIALLSLASFLQAWILPV